MKTIILFILLLPFTLGSYAQDADTQSIHVMVALCDNTYQGIVKVPKGIGNGQDPNTNLYWGCGYGMRTCFKKSADWKEVRRCKVDDIRLERIVFKHKTKNVYLVADAYDGQYIENCTKDFLNSCSGNKKDTLMIGKTVVGLNGNAKLVSYVGHNGLMDFSLLNTYQNKDGKQRDAIIIACASKQYFAPYIKAAKAKPLVWSTHLMSAEAYTVYDAVTAYVNGGNDQAVREAAAAAYNKYQKCGINAARRLIVTGY